MLSPVFSVRRSAALKVLYTCFAVGWPTLSDRTFHLVRPILRAIVRRILELLAESRKRNPTFKELMVVLHAALPIVLAIALLLLLPYHLLMQPGINRNPASITPATAEPDTERSDFSVNSTPQLNILNGFTVAPAEPMLCLRTSALGFSPRIFSQAHKYFVGLPRAAIPD